MSRAFVPSLRTSLLLLAGLALAQPSLALAQAAAPAAQTAVAAADYARAEKFLAATVNPLVVGGSVNAAWLPDDRFTYRNTTADGFEFILVNPSKKTRLPAFDHEKLAATLSAAAGGTFNAKKLPFQSIELSADSKSVSFDVEAKRWSCDVKGLACQSTGAAKGERPAMGRGAGPRGAMNNAVTSPDGKKAVFIKDWNLWVRDVASKEEKALTTDGVKNFGYATDNAGWKTSDRAIVLWSPDSKKVATFQQDERNVGDMHLIEPKPGRSVLKSWKYPLPGDAVVAMLHRVVIDVEAGFDGALQDGPRLSPRHAGRRLLGERHDLEPRRLAARVRVHRARSQVGHRAGGQHRHRRSAHGVRGEREDPFRVAGGLAHSVGDERDHLELAARRLEPSLPVRPRHRCSEEPDHLGPRPRHLDRAGG
jgi:hypothetical protein